MFTAAGSTYQCAQCTAVQPQFQQLAYSYSKQVPNVVSDDNPIVWAIADVDTARQVFAQMQLQTVPHIYIIPPNTDLAKASPLPGQYATAGAALLTESKLLFICCLISCHHYYQFLAVRLTDAIS